MLIFGSPNGDRTRVSGVRGRYPRPLDDGTLRPLQNVPFRSLRLSTQSLRCVQILILKIFNIFLWLKSSRALILNEIEHFSKVSLYGWGTRIRTSVNGTRTRRIAPIRSPRNFLILRILAEKSRENFETPNYLSPTFQHLTR